MTDIPITANERKAQFTGNTGLGPFAFTFNILTNSDIRVIKNSTVLTLTSEYTVTTNVDGTGSVTLTGTGNGTALISSDILTIIGNRQLARTSDYVQGGNLFAEALNEDLDSIVIMMQQLDEKVSRTMRIDAGDIGENLLLPSKASRLNRVLQFNASTGDPEAGPTAADCCKRADQCDQCCGLCIGGCKLCFCCFWFCFVCIWFCFCRFVICR
jgi:hypothetical protein